VEQITLRVNVPTLAGIEPADTQDLADELDANYNTVYSKLRALEDGGEVTRRKVGNANLWMLNKDG